jgi:hypothetical protein
MTEAMQEVLDLARNDIKPHRIAKMLGKSVSAVYELKRRIRIETGELPATKRAPPRPGHGLNIKRWGFCRCGLSITVKGETQCGDCIHSPGWLARNVIRSNWKELTPVEGSINSQSNLAEWAVPPRAPRYGHSRPTWSQKRS